MSLRKIGIGDFIVLWRFSGIWIRGVLLGGGGVVLRSQSCRCSCAGDDADVSVVIAAASVGIGGAGEGWSREGM